MSHSKNFSKPIIGGVYLLKINGYLKTFKVNYISARNIVYGCFISGFHGNKEFELQDFINHLY